MFQDGNSPPRTVQALPIALLILMTAAALIGALHPEIYRDNSIVAAAWRGNDLVTIFLAAPLLAISIIFSRRPHARLILAGMLVYGFYNSAFCLFGAAFNSNFLLYVGQFVVSALALLLAPPDPAGFHWDASKKTGFRVVAVWMALIALFLGGFHIAGAIEFIRTGTLPPVVIKVGHPTNVVAALDLSIICTAMLFGALWLWRGEARGFVLAVMMNVMAPVYLAALTIATLMAGGAGTELMLWSALGMGSLLASTFLLSRLNGGPK
ncbi:MAG: hypothetical protein AB7H86_19205 [Blastocatellales bacterium]